MTVFKIGAAALGLMLGILAASPAGAWKRGAVEVLAVLPDVTPGVKSSVEGITALTVTSMFLASASIPRVPLPGMLCCS
jgi:hypothetical protein